MDFDPYKEWFRIPLARRSAGEPPDHYTLLGISRYENDPNRIHEAALQRMKLLRQRQTGSRADLTQRLMNEVSQARLCLADSTRKAQYDFELEQRFPKYDSPELGRTTGTPAWLVLAACLLILGGGTATYFAVVRSAGKTDSFEEAAKPEPGKNAAPALDEKAAGATEAVLPKPVAAIPAKAQPEKSQPPAKESASSPNPKVTASENPPALVKLRDLPLAGSENAADNDLTHLAALATDADEEDPVFLDAQGRLLGFQRKSGSKSEFLAAERSGPDAAFTTEYAMLGFPPGTRLQGFAIEPDGLTCIIATSEGRGLLQAHRPNKIAAWGMPAPLLAGDEPVKAAWPSLTADGKELFCIQHRNGKPHVLLLKRASPAAFAKPEELAALGTAFSQAAVSPDGKTLALRGPEELYLSRRNDDGSWTPPEVVLLLRAFAGANRALVVSPCFSPDGKWLLFASNRDGGNGGFDLWAAPTSLLKTETPDLSKMADKGVLTKKGPAKKESSAEKTKGKFAGKGTDKSGREKSVKKAPVAVASTNDVPVGDAVTEWLVLGPHPDATKQLVKGLADLKGFEGLDLLRHMPKENQKAGESLSWKRMAKFSAPGVFSVAVSLRLKATSEVRLVVDSAPGGGILWLDGEHGEISWRSGDLWAPFEGKQQGELIQLIAGRHRLVGVVCVSDPTTPLSVRVVGADGAPPEGLSAGY